MELVKAYTHGNQVIRLFKATIGKKSFYMTKMFSSIEGDEDLISIVDEMAIDVDVANGSRVYAQQLRMIKDNFPMYSNVIRYVAMMEERESTRIILGAKLLSSLHNFNGRHLTNNELKAITFQRPKLGATVVGQAAQSLTSAAMRKRTLFSRLFDK